MSKILMNWSRLTCKQLLELNFETDELLKLCQIRQYFPPSKFRAVRHVCTASVMTHMIFDNFLIYVTLYRIFILILAMYTYI